MISNTDTNHTCVHVGPLAYSLPLTCGRILCRAAELVAARRKGCEALGSKFEAPLKEAVR